MLESLIIACLLQQKPPAESLLTHCKLKPSRVEKNLCLYHYPHFHDIAGGAGLQQPGTGLLVLLHLDGSSAKF